MPTYNIYLGLSTPDGDYVDDAQFNKFLDTVNNVVPGYTLTAAEGRWNGKPEDTMILTVATSNYDTVLCIAMTYKEMFNQEAVAILPLQSMTFV